MYIYLPTQNLQLVVSKTSPQIHSTQPGRYHPTPCADPETGALCEPGVPEPLTRQTPRYTYRCAVRQGWGQNGCGPSAPTRRLRHGGQRWYYER